MVSRSRVWLYVRIALGAGLAAVAFFALAREYQWLPGAPFPAWAFALYAFAFFLFGAPLTFLMRRMWPWRLLTRALPDRMTRPSWETSPFDKNSVFALNHFIASVFLIVAVGDAAASAVRAYQPWIITAMTIAFVAGVFGGMHLTYQLFPGSFE